MIKTINVIEVKRYEKIFSLHIENSSTLGEVFDVLCEMRSFIVEKINEATKMDAKEKEADNVG